MLWVTIGIVVASTAGMITWVTWSVKRDRKKLRELRRTPIGQLTAGSRVRIIGTARKLDGDVGGIYTGKPCLACHGWISGDPDGNFSEPDDRVVAFRVEDETGSINITVGHTKLHLSGAVVDMKDSHAFGASIMRREAGGISYWEDRLDADTRVAVIGYVLTGDDGTLHLAGRGNDPLVIANVTAAFE